MMTIAGNSNAWSCGLVTTPTTTTTVLLLQTHAQCSLVLSPQCLYFGCELASRDFAQLVLVPYGSSQLDSPSSILTNLSLSHYGELLQVL